MTTTTADDLHLLIECHKEKLAMRQRHVAVARLVTNYSFNNTYQYVIAREDVHVSWLEAAIQELGGTPDRVDEPSLPPAGKGAEAFRPLVEADARDAAAFVARWRPRVGEITHARHRSMLHVVLGEVLEHKRFFDQILAGRDDLLGRRM